MIEPKEEENGQGTHGNQDFSRTGFAQKFMPFAPFVPCGRNDVPRSVIEFDPIHGIGMFKRLCDFNAYHCGPVGGGNHVPIKVSLLTFVCCLDGGGNLF